MLEETCFTRPLAHTAASGLISVFVGFYFKSFPCAAASFLSGILIDADHVIDYYFNHNFTLNLRAIYDACIEVNFSKLYILLHSYELIALLWITIYVFSLSDIWIAIAIGMTQHIIFDQMTNPLNSCGYFLIYRILVGFSKNRLFARKL